jgi:hypothetical protein
MIDAPNNEHITLLEAKVNLEYDADKGTGLQAFNGSVRVPFPDLGFMSGVEVKDPAYAAVGYDRARTSRTSTRRSRTSASTCTSRSRLVSKRASAI